MNEDPPPSPWRALLGLLVIIVLIGGVWFVMQRLKEAGRMQDCLASGRSNCAPIDADGNPAR